MTDIQSNDTRGVVWLRLLLLIGGVCCIICIVPQYFSYPLGHDQISYLIEAKRALGGDQLYGRYIAETNPPLIIWFSAIPVALSHNVHSLESSLFRFLVFGLLCGSVWWSIRIVRQTKTLPGFDGLLIFTFAMLWAELPPDVTDFGQREHLLLIFLLPYLVAVATRASTRLAIAELVALGLAASAGIWFKPHNIIVALALQLFICLWDRSYLPIIAPEFIGLIGGSFLILLSALVFAPLYFTNTLPMLMDTYWALGSESAVTLARNQHLYNIAIVLFVLLWLVFRRRLRNQIAPIALLLCSCVTSIAFDIQHIPWGYHKYPQIALMEIAMAYFAADLLAEWGSRRTTWSSLYALAITAGLCLCLFGSIRVLRRTWRDAHHHDPVSGLDALLQQCAPKETVYAFSTSVPPMAAAYRHDLIWGSRFAHLWMMPALVQNELGPVRAGGPFKRLPPQRLAELARIQREDMVEDLTYWKPALVLVQRCSYDAPCQGLEGRDFDLIGWFLKDPEFAQIWSRYKRQPPVGGFDVYRDTAN